MTFSNSALIVKEIMKIWKFEVPELKVLNAESNKKTRWVTQKVHWENSSLLRNEHHGRKAIWAIIHEIDAILNESIRKCSEHDLRFKCDASPGGILFFKMPSQISMWRPPGGISFYKTLSQIRNATLPGRDFGLHAVIHRLACDVQILQSYNSKWCLLFSWQISKRTWVSSWMLQWQYSSAKSITVR